MAINAHTVTVKLAQLTEHLDCALCRGILRDAHTIPDCLHSFCKSCIYRHFLVKGSRLCPKCNKLLCPRPIATLIMDQKLQAIVDRIFPEFKEQEEALEREFYAINNFKLKKETITVERVDLTCETSSARERSKNLITTKTTHTAKSTSNGGGTLSDKQLTIEVCPHQLNDRVLPTLKFPFMQVNGNFKMSELCKLICKRLKLADEVQLEIACMGVTVGPELSVLFIQRTIWQHHKQNEPLVLHYRHITS